MLQLLMGQLPMLSVLQRKLQSRTALVTPLDFLVVRNVPFDSISSSTTLESPQANIDYYRRQNVTLDVWGKEVLLGLLGYLPVVDGGGTDSDDFTSPGETQIEKLAASFTSKFGSSGLGSDTGQELELKILNKEQYEPDLYPL